MQRPSQVQLALAIAIVRSKPATLAIRDYAAQLRSHIKSGAQPISTANRHVDQAAYWQAHCIQLESDLRKKDFELAKLLHDKTSFENRLNDNDTRPKRARTNKRHHDGTFVSAADYSTVKVRSGIKAADHPLGLDPTLAVLQKSIQGQAVLAHLFHLGRPLSTSSESHQRRLVDCAEALHNLVHLVLSSKLHNPDSTIVALSQAWTVLLSRSNFGLISERAPAIGQIIYHLVSSFAAILSSLENLAESNSSKEQISEPRVKSYVQGLDKLLASASLSPDLHSDAKEGMTFLVLRAIAKLLIAANFGIELRPARAGIQIPTPASQTLLDDAQEQLSPPARTLAPHLLALLKRCLDVMTSGRGDAELKSRLQSKMQTTLFAHVFGQSTGDIFSLPSLPQMVPRAADTTLTTEPDLQTTDGLVEGLWTIIGWDVLAGACSSFE